jgi:molybdopterin converting factor subunit 1
MNQVTVLFFATIRELTGTRQISLDLPDGASVADAKDILIEKYPSLKLALDTTVVAVNREFSPDEVPLPQGAEIAIFPPVSGGSSSQAELQPTIVAITEAEIDLNQLLAQITLPATGAACLFSGTVRAVTRRGDPHETSYLEYEAYQPMAEDKMRQVAGEIRQRWPDVQGVAIVQRVGRLNPGTPTVLIACTAAHRDTGVFEAARYGIDRLKEIVPVWKKEVGPDGETWLEGEYHPTPED